MLKVALVYFGGLAVLNLITGAVAMPSIRRAVPGWRKQGDGPRPLVIVEGPLRANAPEPLAAPITGLPCVAWRVRLAVRQGVGVVERLQRHSVGDLTIDTDAGPVALRLRPSSSAPSSPPHSDDWSLSPDRFAVSRTVRLRGGQLIEPAAHELRRAEAEALTARALTWLRANSRYATRPADEVSDLHYVITESRIEPGEAVRGEGPSVSEPETGIERVDHGDPGILLGPAREYRRAMRSLLLAQFSAPIVFNTLFILVFVIGAIVVALQ